MNTVNQLKVSTTSPHKMAIHDEPSSILLIDNEKEFNIKTKIQIGNTQIHQIRPKEGFTLYMWIMIYPSINFENFEGGHIFQFVRNACFRDVTVRLSEYKLLIEIGDSNSEKMFSEMALKPLKWYLISLVLEQTGSATSVTLFINGRIDSSTIKQNLDPLQECDLYIGQFKNFNSFIGKITNAFLFYKPLVSENLLLLYKKGYQFDPSILKNDIYNQFLIDEYSKAKEIPIDVISPKKIQSPILEACLNMQQTKLLQKLPKLNEFTIESNILALNDFLDENPLLKLKTLDLYKNFNWILTVVSAMSTGTIERNGKIEFDRFFKVISVVSPQISKEDIYMISDILKSSIIESSTMSILYFYFLNPFYFIHQNPQNLPIPPDPEEEIEKSKVLPTPGKSFFVGKYNKNNNTINSINAINAASSENQDLGENEGEQTEEIKESSFLAPLPKLKEDWASGEIEIHITRCFDCHKHFTSRTHKENEYIRAFNSLGNDIKNIFPNAIVKGNYELPMQMSAFDVYMYGVSPEENPKKLLYSKAITKRFPSSKEILDKIILLCFSVGDSLLLASIQKEYSIKNRGTIPKASNVVQEHPISQMPTDNNSAKSPGPKSDALICINWGCGKEFTRGKEGGCCHHPGRFDFGSIRGIWPEGWTCCRGSWESQGCENGSHKGVVKSNYQLFCVNHGEINPKTGYPDSFCGLPFGENATSQCSYHSGYCSNGHWSCCNTKGADAEGCITGSHASAKYPEEKAKLYFFPNPFVNPGINRFSQDSDPNVFHKYGRLSGYFKKVGEFKAYNKKNDLANFLDANKDKPRYCLNWGCETSYLDTENKKKKLCCYHPGKWDFGNTGYKITDVMSGINAGKISWKPHWTCCMRDWSSIGCKKGYHNGPLINKDPPRKYKWPDVKAMSYFRKTISPHWEKLVEEEYLYGKEKVIMKFNKLLKEKGANGKLGTENLGELLNRLNFHFLVISSHIEYQLKYITVIDSKADKIIDDGQGYIDLGKFLSWWFASAEELCETNKF